MTIEAGFIKLVTLLLTLSDVGVVANPKAPSSAEITRYAPARADAMAYVDLQAILPNNYKALRALPTHPGIKKNPATRKAAQQLVTWTETGINMVKGVAGIDVVKDLSWAAGWVQLRTKGDPDFLLVVHGNFPSDLLNRIGGMAGSPARKQGAGTAILAPGGDEMLGLTSDGTLLIGTTSWIKARLTRRWRSRARFKRLPKLLDAKPFMLIASSPSNRAKRLYKRELASDPDAAMFANLLTGHHFAAVSLAHDGVSWDWVARDKRGHSTAVMVSRGLIDILRSGHLMMRGYTRLALAALRSYTNSDPIVAMLVKNEAAILTAVTANTGDGNFKVDFKNQPNRRTLHVRAWGKELGHVIPLAGVLPAVMGGAYFAFAATGPQQHPQPPPRRARRPAVRARP